MDEALNALSAEFTAQNFGDLPRIRLAPGGFHDLSNDCIEGFFFTCTEFSHRFRIGRDGSINGGLQRSGIVRLFESSRLDGLIDHRERCPRIARSTGV